MSPFVLLRTALFSAVLVLTVGSPRASVPAPRPVFEPAVPAAGGERNVPPDFGDGSGRHRMLAV